MDFEWMETCQSDDLPLIEKMAESRGIDASGTSFDAYYVYKSASRHFEGPCDYSSCEETSCNESENDSDESENDSDEDSD
jgi:hypothetical protein